MITASSKKYDLLWWPILLFGVVLFIVMGANMDYDAITRSPIGTIISSLIIFSCFIFLPLYSLFISGQRELVIDKRFLIITSWPSKKEKGYDLRNLVWWEETLASGRFQLGRNLYLVFLNEDHVQQKLHLSEMEFKNFDAVVAYFDSEFKRIKKRGRS